MKDFVHVSIIIPTYNAQDYISETLNSVLLQSYTNWECIVIDDGSTDQTTKLVLEYALKDKRIHLIETEVASKGAAVCRNIGLRIAHGSYVIFLDSDDLLASDCLKNRIHFVEENPDLDFVVFQMETFGLGKELMTKFSEDYLASFASFDLKWQTSCPIWKKSYLVYLGGFSEQLFIFEDPELHLKALQSSNRFVVLHHANPDSYYRVRERSILDKNEIYFRKMECYITYIEKAASFLHRKNIKGLRNCGYSFFMNLLYPITPKDVTLILKMIKISKKYQVIGSLKYEPLIWLLSLLTIFSKWKKEKYIVFCFAILFSVKRFSQDYLQSKTHKYSKG